MKKIIVIGLVGVAVAGCAQFLPTKDEMDAAQNAVQARLGSADCVETPRYCENLVRAANRLDAAKAYLALGG